MDKLKMTSCDKIEENIDYIFKKFPNVITEVQNKNGIIERKIDFDILKQELSQTIIDDKQERYNMIWPDKKKSILLANSKISSTLRPIISESNDFQNTKNIYIKGDNLDVLKILRETYLEKIKIIYIDPPYNTGSDFVYSDNFKKNANDYLIESGQYDEEGNKLITNLETNGRFHTNWLNMIYPRLKVAKDLLTQDGIIFISIDDNEVANLRRICDEIFGENNFVAQIIVEGTPKNDPKIISTAHEYCLVYVKNYSIAKDCEWGIYNPIYDDLLDIIDSSGDNFKLAEENIKKYYKKNKLDDDNIHNYKNVDELGLYRIGPIDDPQSGGPKDERFNPITGEKLKTPNRGWGCSISKWKEWVKNGEILFPETNDKLCSRKVYIKKGKMDLLRAYFKIQTRKDTDYLTKLFGKKVFSFPKPVELIKKFIDSSIQDKGIVLDFFGGSSTTAEAVMQLKAERNSNNISYIIVQLEEDLENNLLHAKGNREKQVCKNAIEFCKNNNLPLNLTSIGIERIIRSANRIKNDFNILNDLDFGFRVFKLDSSNMNDVYYNPLVFNQNLLDSTIDNVKIDRNSLDLLFQVLLELGIELSSKIEEKNICNKICYFVNGNSLVACFENELNNEIVKEITKVKPLYAIFKDSSFESDSANINCEQLFKTYSPNTILKVV